MTEVIQLTGSSDELISHLVISTNSNLDMLVVLRYIYKDSLVTKKYCNGLWLSSGNKHVLGSSIV